jgi:two-component system response regulator FixJ
MLNFHISPIEGGHFMKTRIFFVDDDEQNRNLMKRFLEHYGYEVSVFGTGKVCEMDEEQKCMLDDTGRCADIIISDIHMPIISGVEFVEKLISSQCKCPNIALISGGWSSEKLQKAKSFNCKIFEKPFEFEDILGWIRECEKKTCGKSILQDNFIQDGACL